MPPCFASWGKRGLSTGALRDELRSIIQAEYVPLLSLPGVIVFVTAFWGNLRVDYLATIRAMPDRGIGPPMVHIGAADRLHRSPRYYPSLAGGAGRVADRATEGSQYWR